MQYLFVHANFPAQFRHMAAVLARDPANRVVFATMTPRPEWDIPGVAKAVFQAYGEPAAQTHPLVRDLEDAVRKGMGAARACELLKSKGFSPDVVVGHSGWGQTLFLLDVFPKAGFVGYFEWFYDAASEDALFERKQRSLHERCAVRLKNVPILADLAVCRAGLCPTQWQAAQFPADLRSKLTVLHDGIDTGFFAPEPGVRLVLPGLDLSAAGEIVTFSSRGLEPYRGFPSFMRAILEVLEKRPRCHAVVVGEDRSCYGPAPKDGRTWRQVLNEELAERLAPVQERLHFTGSLPYGQYRHVLQASSLHVYLTRPFVLSWSFLEAMACGCLLVASDTPPVREVARHGENALLADFNDPQAIAAAVMQGLDSPELGKSLREGARRTALEGYDLKTLLPRQLELLRGAAAAPTA